MVLRLRRAELENDYFTALRVDARYIGSLPKIAAVTCEGKIIGAAVLFGDNVPMWCVSSL